jgi:RimJ/RimL family protein N-acetyltransferase
MNRALDTKRLALRPFAADEAGAWHSIWGDPEVIWWGANESLDRSREQLESLVAAEAAWPEGVGWLAVRRKGEQDVIGDVLVQPARFVDGIEIGWHFRRPAWGHGYATEAARAVLERTLADKVCDKLYAIVALENERSLRVVEKLGMEAIRDMEYADLPHRLFSRSNPCRS